MNLLSFAALILEPQEEENMWVNACDLIFMKP